jgi:hypothetical protein
MEGFSFYLSFYLISCLPCPSSCMLISNTRSTFLGAAVISSMQFTHYTPGREPYSMECNTLETLQIISVKLTELSDGLELPLSVYGVVAVRDMVDRKRNILFSRDMSDPQELKQNVCMLLS